MRLGLITGCLFSCNMSIAASALPAETNNVTFVEVANSEELTNKFANILSSEDGSNLFYLKDENVFVTRKEGSKDLDDLIPRFWKKKKSTVDWIFLNASQPQVVTYPGYIPVTECQSQKYGQGGSIAFEYQISNAISHGYKFGLGTSINPVITWNIAVKLAMQLNSRLKISSGSNVGGKTRCFLEANQTGQLLIKPKYLQIESDSRRARWSKPLKKWLLDDQYTRYEPFYALIERNHYQTDCITDDVAPLFCDVKLGQPNWDEPLGVDYDKFQLVSGLSISELIETSS